MTNTEAKPDAQVVLDELKSQATSAEDKAYLEQEQVTLDSERANAIADLGKGVTRLEVDNEGIVHDAAVVQESIARGEERSGANTAGRQA